MAYAPPLQLKDIIPQVIVLNKYGVTTVVQLFSKVSK